ncbi:MAG TPA: SagB/ThcOx family dehydrogenase [Candidatus Hydrogenedentes bacterium]|nr:SagB/ThcOx family dehydrogenase [Candidatus Hydrogenedentota bacterium]HPG66382.1 SagB/ThcOx family dehydrogenase [Candidatus Hydrogenedentota bacterium]
MDDIHANREFMKSEFGLPKALRSDQGQGLPPPPFQKPYAKGARVIDLPTVTKEVISTPELLTCLRRRRSRRRFSRNPISLAELSFLLWATQGIDEADPYGYASMRPAPSAGARHPYETYVAVNRVVDLDPGVYRYLPVDHKLVFEFAEPELPRRLTEAALGQDFVGGAAAVCLWTCIPYRGEWRYNIRAHRVMLIDAGHLCQNLYLACEAIGCGTCAIGAYDQRATDALLRVDGHDEYTVYLAPVGKT